MGSWNLLALALWGVVLIVGCSPGRREALRARESMPDAGSCKLQPDSDASVVAASAGAQAARDAQDAHDAGTDELVPDPALRAQRHRFFEIRVLDASDRTPIAGVQLETVNHILYRSDKNGRVAFYEPGLMSTNVFFTPSRVGYTRAADGFGYRGLALPVSEGGMGELLLERTMETLQAVPESSSDLATRLLQADVPGANACFGLQLIAADTRRGVPLIFATLDSQGDDRQYISDSQGVIAICNPDLLGTRKRFSFDGDGYHADSDSAELDITAGEIARMPLIRDNIAERLYRSTGQGIYTDSLRLGLRTRTAALGNGLVMAQDAVSKARFHEELFWIWGITHRPNHPLGNFTTTAARSAVPAPDAISGITYDYIVDDNGYARGIIDDIAPTSQATWVNGLVNVLDADGQEALFATFVKPNVDLSINKRGLLRFDSQRERLAATGLEYPLTDFVAPTGQPLRFGDYLYYGSVLRIPATAEALLDTSRYEVWTALGADGQLAREADGSPAYRWRTAGLEMTESQLTAAGSTASALLTGHVTAVDDQRHIDVDGNGAVGYDAQRQRFVRVVAQKNGSSSFLGEVWYMEADTPLGPWLYARKVLTADAYSFYSPWLHQDFDPSGRYLYFEATYTDALARDVAVPTARYDRNQLMYRLDVNDPRLGLPVAIYALGADYVDKLQLPTTGPARTPAFFALDRRTTNDDVVAVAWTHASCSPARRLVASTTPNTEPLFYGVTSASSARARGMVPLYAYRDAEGVESYALGGAVAAQGSTRVDPPLIYVWPNAIQVALPVPDYHARSVDAGPDQCLQASSATSTVEVELAGSTNVQAISYAWHALGAPCLVAETSSARLRLPTGVHSFQLVVTDDKGLKTTDSVIIEITAPEN